MVPEHPNASIRTIRLNVLIILSLYFTAFGYRPFATDDAGMVTPVTFELETAADYWSDAPSAQVSFKHGITERMDIGIAFGKCIFSHDTHGYNPAELLLKFSLIPEHFAASLSGSFGSSCYSMSAIWSQTVSLLEMHINTGFSTDATLENGFGTFSAAIVFPLEQFAFGVECGGTEESFDWWQCGGRFAISDAIAVDAGIGSNIASEFSWNATTGLFFAFPPSEKGM